jgi:hypothetical protein
LVKILCNVSNPWQKILESRQWGNPRCMSASKVPKWPDLCWRCQKLRTSIDE